jgi:hypothetical protein
MIQPTLADAGRELDGGAVVPGFRLRIADLFAATVLPFEPTPQ